MSDRIELLLTEALSQLEDNWPMGSDYIWHNVRLALHEYRLSVDLNTKVE